VVPLFRPYRGQVVAVVGLIVVTSTIGIVNPLLIQVVFNKALFVRGGPRLGLLFILVGIMAAVPSLCQEQFEGGRVQWRCPGGDVLADGTVRQREAQPA
jgi:ABC-type bacteriocin/lantibiotic exporter with double-glycine peptidase domain